MTQTTQEGKEKYKIGDKVHVNIRKYGKITHSWNGVIVDDAKGLGDGKTPYWCVDKVNSLSEWNKQGSIVVGEDELEHL